MKTIELVNLLQRVSFTTVKESDYDAFAGIQSDDALIGEIEDGVTVIIDGDNVCVVDQDGNEEQFLITQTI